MSIKKKFMALVAVLVVAGSGAFLVVNAEAVTTSVTGGYAQGTTPVSSVTTGSTVNLTVTNNQPNTQDPYGSIILTWPAGQYTYVTQNDASATCVAYRLNLPTGGVLTQTYPLPVANLLSNPVTPTGTTDEVECTGYTNFTGNTSGDVFTLVANGVANSTSSVSATVNSVKTAATNPGHPFGTGVPNPNTNATVPVGNFTGSANASFALSITAATGATGPAGPAGPPGATGATGASAGTHGGYYEVAADGGVFCFGGAVFYGSTGGIKLNSPITGMSVTAGDLGYYLYAADGGVFAFGNAQFAGSMGGVKLNQPMVGGAQA